MTVSTRYVLHQGPVLGALGRAALAAIKSAQGGSASSAQQTTIPGRELREVVPALPTELVRDYVRNVGGDPSAYRGQVPAHLFPQWVFPLQSRGLEEVSYPMHKVLNGGCRLEINGPLPLGEPLTVSCRLEDIDDDGKRAILHQRAVTGTAQLPEAVVSHTYAFVPLAKKGSKGEKKGPAAKKKAPPRVPEDARELAFWSIPQSAGLDFAKLTGDFNPIHWIPAAARANGFKNVILHGFGTLARAIEGLNRGLFAGDTTRLATIDVRFTRPLVLPAKVGLYVRGDEVFVGAAPGGPANLVGTFTTR